jgi:hypothetical protein
MTFPNCTPTPEEIKAECAKIQAGWTDVRRRQAEGKTEKTDGQIEIPEFSDFDELVGIRPWRKEL